MTAAVPVVVVRAVMAAVVLRNPVMIAVVIFFMVMMVLLVTAGDRFEVGRRECPKARSTLLLLVVRHGFLQLETLDHRDGDAEEF
jgi:hypothetical protein